MGPVSQLFRVDPWDRTGRVRTTCPRLRKGIADMRNRFTGTIVGIVGAAALVFATTLAFRIVEQPVAGQARAYRAPRTPDGKPNLNGIWQAVNTASWNLQDHPSQASPVIAMGARGAIPGGLSVVEGGEIPYKPEAAAKKAEN